MKCAQSRLPARRLSNRSAVLFAAAIGAAGVAHAQASDTWAAGVGTAGGSWSVPSNWAGGSAAHARAQLKHPWRTTDCEIGRQN